MVSAFFSASETALMCLNRYRLRHQARAGHRGARVAERLLQRPDRLIGLILLGNTAANIGAASIVTIIALRIGGESALFAATVALTVVMLIFAEVAPKTLAALNPPRYALPAALIYFVLLKIAYPIVWLINLFTNGLLRLLGVRPDEIASHSLSAEELRTVVAEAGVMVPRRHQRMLLSVLDLDAITVDDVMVPRQEVIGLDLDRAWEDNLAIIQDSHHDRLPVYREDIDNIVGVTRVRDLLPELVARRAHAGDPARADPRTAFRARGHAADEAALELPAAQAPLRVRRRRVRRRAGADHDARYPARDRRRARQRRIRATTSA